jgi:transposase
MKPISLDLRKRIVEAYDAGEGTRQEIAERFKVSVHMVKKLLSQQRKLGSLEAQTHRCGRKPKLDDEDKQWLRETVKKRPDITLEELRQAFAKPCCIVTIFRGLRELRSGYKKNAQSRRAKPS